MTAPVPDMTLSIQVKAYDIDVAGIVHNSVYCLWLDDIRTAFLEKVQAIEEQVRLGYMPVLSKTEISYRRAIKFGDKPIAHMYLTLLTRARWRISCDFMVDGVITTQATQEGCVVHIASGRPLPAPEPFVRYWEQKQRDLGRSAPDLATDHIDDHMSDHVTDHTTDRIKVMNAHLTEVGSVQN